MNRELIRRAHTDENLYEPGCIRLNSGVYFNLLAPTPEMIKIEDIAHALSRQHRFGGHLPVEYTVAHHSIACAIGVTRAGHPQYELEALLHDASEAYLMDIPTPVKKLIPAYYELEDRINRVIAEAFSLTYPWPEPVKIVDQMELEWEWKSYMIGGREPGSWGSVRRIFINKFNDLKR